MIMEVEESNRKYPRFFGAKHKDINIRSFSRSGGAFTAISDAVLAKDEGVVYGCAIDEQFVVVHKRATSAQERDAFRGSKYVQSDLGIIFKDIKRDLLENRFVLFSGTPCQVDGLKGFLGDKEFDNLLLVDIVCMGVPSPRVWRDYIRWVEKVSHNKIKEVNFRNKQYGWRKHVESLTLERGEWNHSVFANLFYGHNILRPSCYKCPYKDIYHPSDITLADFWGIENVRKDFDDDQGVSLVIINSDKGLAVYDQIKKDLEMFECGVEDCKQEALYEPCECPQSRDKFWEEYSHKSFLHIAKKHGKYKSSAIKSTIKRIFNRR